MCHKQLTSRHIRISVYGETKPKNT